MSAELTHNEQKAEKAFSKQSVVFDQQYSSDAIIQYKRTRVRTHISKFLPAGASILELNSGTGEDAIWLAEQGHRVHATDISVGMQEQLMHKLQERGLQQKVTNELCSFTQLQQLRHSGPFDHIFSNFAGLNCTRDLKEVVQSFHPILKKGATVTLVLLPGWCLWESLMVFRGKFRTATRRWFSSKGVKAHIEGEYFRCWYYNPSVVKEYFGENYELIALEGLCTFVPPSYIQGFSEKYPKLFRFLKKWEDRLKTRWPWRSIGDYYIISFRKTG